jgi:hypothetical protein
MNGQNVKNSAAFEECIPEHLPEYTTRQQHSNEILVKENMTPGKDSWTCDIKVEGSTMKTNLTLAKP